jgi:5'-3' exonuclease
LSALLGFILTWVGSGVTPIFIFDGDHLPDKIETQTKRRRQNQTTQLRIDQITTASQSDPGLDLRADLGRHLSNLKDLNQEDQSILQQVLDGIGVPWLQAVGEGEHLCSVLCMEGHVGGVWSVDTDNLAYGCPLLITGFASSSRGRARVMECVRLDRIHAGLGLSQPTFLDLCIMAGCDHNTKIPGLSIETIYTTIAHYKSIDNLPPTYRVEGLRHIRCREIFGFQPSPSLMTPERRRLNLEPRTLEQIYPHLEVVGLGDQSERLSQAYAYLTAFGMPAMPSEITPEVLEESDSPGAPSTSEPVPRYLRLRIIS